MTTGRRLTHGPAEDSVVFPLYLVYDTLCNLHCISLLSPNIAESSSALRPARPCEMFHEPPRSRGSSCSSSSCFLPS